MMVLPESGGYSPQPPRRRRRRNFILPNK